jgi:hypothetical protein
MRRVKAFECVWVVGGKDETPCAVAIMCNCRRENLISLVLVLGHTQLRTFVRHFIVPSVLSGSLAGSLRRWAWLHPFHHQRGREIDNDGRVLAVRTSIEFWVVMRKVEHQLRMMESSPAWFGQELADRAEQKSSLCIVYSSQFLTQNQTWPLLALRKCNHLCLCYEWNMWPTNTKQKPAKNRRKEYHILNCNCLTFARAVCQDLGPIERASV